MSDEAYTQHPEDCGGVMENRVIGKVLRDTFALNGVLSRLMIPQRVQWTRHRMRARSQPFQGACRIGKDSSLKKHMRALNRGLL
jgi:hypothetical protein